MQFIPTATDAILIELISWDSFKSPIGGQNKKRCGPNSSVRLAYFQANHLLTELYKQERKYIEEKMTGTLNIKQTLIATVRNHILTVACFLTPLPFHYPLPLKAQVGKEEGCLKS